MFSRSKRWAVPAVLAVMAAGLAACEPARNVAGTLSGSTYTITWDRPNCEAEGSCENLYAYAVFIMDVTAGREVDTVGTPCVVFLSAAVPENQCQIDVGTLGEGNYIFSVFAAYDWDGSNPPSWASQWYDKQGGGLTAQASEAIYACWSPLDPVAYAAQSNSSPYTGGWALTKSGCSAGSWTFGDSVEIDSSGEVAVTTEQPSGTTVSSAPTDVSATAGSGEAMVSWTAPASDGGAAITGYTVTSSPDSKTCSTTSATSCTVTGLTNGTAYTFTVVATNSVGDSAASAASAAVTPSAPATAPGVPSDVAAVAGDGSAEVSWTAPASDGGAEITGYTVTAAPGGASCSTTGATSCTVTGLENFTGYTFTVTATNSVGTSDASDASDVVVPSSGEFQVWLPKPVVARDGDTQVWVFGATGVDTVKVRIGLEVFEASPDAAGIAIVDYTMSTPSALTQTGRVRVIAAASRVAEDGSKEKLRATAVLYSPSTTLRKKWREGSQVTARVRSAGEATALSFRIDGTEVCSTDADDRGRASCTFDAPTEGGYTLQTYIGEQLTGENEFVVTAWGLRLQ